MCGIGGFQLSGYSGFSAEKLLRDLQTAQQHRGPDGQGIWICDRARTGLCHSRLAIVDTTSLGAQPMCTSDGRFAITFNGEIYNWKEIRNKLESNGIDFRSHSDTEVILQGYRQWGTDVLKKLQGMFAFAIWDHQEKTLFCARDRIGKKPFVYAQTSQGFFFASEISALKKVADCAGIDMSVDDSALAAMLLHNLRHVPDPNTVYRGMKRLRAGHAILVHNGRVSRSWRYWQPTAMSGPSTPAKLRTILEEAVALRMRADVPVGALLSGGVDSSAIVAMMQRNTEHPVRTYALGLNKDDEDLVRARLMAKYLGTCHKEYYFDAAEQWSVMNALITRHGEPIMLLPLVHTYTLCRAIREDGIKVVLSGNGADELFYGYTGHTRTLRLSRWLDRIAPVQSFLKPLRNTGIGWISAPPGERKAAFYETITRRTWKKCLDDDAVVNLKNVTAEEMRYWGRLCPSTHYIDESNFIGLMLENTHSVTTAADLPPMEASVEMRAPFLDQEIVSFALGTPAHLKIPDTRNPNWLKAILREAVRDLLPETLLNAPKRGFGYGIQERDVLLDSWKKNVDMVLNDFPDIVPFSPQKIRKLWQLANQRRAGDWALIARLLAIGLWYREAW